MRCILPIAFALLAVACTGKADPQPAPKPDPSPKEEYLLPVIPEDPFLFVQDLEIEGDSSQGGSMMRWLDFQTGRLFRQSDRSALLASAVIDAGVFPDDKGLRFVSPGGTAVPLAVDSPSSWPVKLLTRFHTLSPSEMDAKKFASIKTRSQLSGFPLEDGTISSVLSTSSLSPFQSDVINNTPMYIGFKTYNGTEGNNFGIIEVRSVSMETGKRKIVISYKMGTSSWKTDYSGVEPVTIKNGKFYISGKEFRAEGSASSMNLELTSEYGGSLVRVYGMNKNLRTAKLLDDMQAANLKVFFSMSLGRYKDKPELYENPDNRKATLERVVATVEAYKDHPAVLCWNMGDEVDLGMTTDKFETIYTLVDQIAAAIKAVDKNHPVAFDLPGAPGSGKVKSIIKYCPNIDFLSIDAYLTNLDNMDANLRSYGWTKPFFVAEYGPMGTWKRDLLLVENRVNSWGNLIQLSSEEAAAKYVECYRTIEKFKGCLGSSAFLWGYQGHGEVLGWYSMFTKDGYHLASVEAMRNCWKGENRPYTCPLIESWSRSIRLNGKTAGEERNPVVTAGSSCTASVEASSRNGNPLKYKWFIYADNIYDVSFGLTQATMLIPCESMSDGSMNEDANKALFVDRTLPDVSFTAPSKAGNYRLYVIAYEPASMSAATACLNFQVK